MSGIEIGGPASYIGEGYIGGFEEASSPAVSGTVDRAVMAGFMRGVMFGVGGYVFIEDGSAMELISRNTFTTASSFDVTGFNSSTYDIYKLYVYGVVSNDDVRIRGRTSTDGGASFDSGASNYAWANTESSGSTGFNAADVAINFMDNQRVGNAAGENFRLEITIIRPDQATFSMIHWLGGMNYATAGSAQSYTVGSGARLTEADIDALRLLVSAGTFTGGYSFYGIRNS